MIVPAGNSANPSHLFVKQKKRYFNRHIGMNSAFINGNKRMGAMPASSVRFQLMLYYMAWLGRQSRWVVRKSITVKRIKCLSALLKIQNNRKNAAFLRNQAMNIAACIWYLMSIAIAWMLKWIPAGKMGIWLRASLRTWIGAIWMMYCGGRF